MKYYEKIAATIHSRSRYGSIRVYNLQVTVYGYALFRWRNTENHLRSQLISFLVVLESSKLTFLLISVRASLPRVWGKKHASSDLDIFHWFNSAVLDSSLNIFHGVITQKQTSMNQTLTFFVAIENWKSALESYFMTIDSHFEIYIR